MKRLPYLAAAAGLLALTSCRKPQRTEDMAADATNWEPGIYSAARQDDGVVLSVVLLAEKKMQFYAGERLLAVHWTVADASTDVFIAVRDGGLILGSGITTSADPLGLGEVVFSDSFPDLKAGVNDIVLGTEDGKIPFGVRLIPSTENEMRAIENHEPAGRADSVSTGAPPEQKPFESLPTTLSPKARSFVESVEKDPTGFFFSVSFWDQSGMSQGIVFAMEAAHEDDEKTIVIDKKEAMAMTLHFANSGMLDKTDVPPPGLPLTGWNVNLSTKKVGAYWHLGRERDALLKSSNVMGVRSVHTDKSLKAWDDFMRSVRDDKPQQIVEPMPDHSSKSENASGIDVDWGGVKMTSPAQIFPDKLWRTRLQRLFPCAFLFPVMPKPRFLAPWHQPDLMAELEEDGLSVEELAALKGKPAIYHCVSRVVNREFVLGDEEREQFVRYMRDYERFCGLRVLAFCVMSNHFHILLEVPMAPEERGADWSDKKLLDHLSALYSKQQMGVLRWELEHCREQNNTEAAEAFRERYFRRMWDLSQFMKTLKQRFTRWFNKHHGRKGTLWEERFKSVLVEDGHAARTMAAYIDLNPVRAGMVDDPKDYRWCSYAEAVAGKKRSREGLQRVMFEAGAAELAEEIAMEELISWRKASYHYRQILHMAVNRDDPNLDPEDARQLTEAEALVCRIREMIDGMALGTEPFIENIFGWCRALFSEKRKSGARKMKGMTTPLRTLRDLRVDPPPG